MLEARFSDAVKSSYKSPKFIGFLDPAELEYIKEISKYERQAKVIFWGGFCDAERKFVAVTQDDLFNEEFPIVAISLIFRVEDKLSHRDFLGSFMSLGINRNCLGDILCQDGKAVVFVKKELESYFLTNITKIAKVGVKCFAGTNGGLPNAHSFLDMSGVVASERADCVVAFLMKSSREKAVKAIKSGIVIRNYKELTSVSDKISENDKISVRGMGKFLVSKLGPLTKKERMVINCKKYL